PEVRRMDSQDQSHVVARVLERALVVTEMRLVRRPDLDEARARLSHDVGDPEAPADLDELTERDDDASPRGEGGEGDERRRGVVVDDGRRGRAGHLAEESGDRLLAAVALARGA